MMMSFIMKPGLLLLPLLLHAAGPVHAFTPTDTDCMRWALVSCNDGDCPLLSPSPLVIGHQICSAQGGASQPDTSGGVQGMQICTDKGGTQVGHQNIFASRMLGYDSRCAGSGRECWVRQGGSSKYGEQIDSFWVANMGKVNLTWTLFRKGDPTPTNAYKVGGLLLARSLGNASNQYGDRGNVMPGWVQEEGAAGVLGSINYEDYGSNSADAYFLATCHRPTRLRYACDNRTHQCVTLPPSSASGFPTQQACATQCHPPPPPPPGPPPPPPQYSKPYLRFAMAIPVAHRVDCTVVQGSKTHTWTGYGEGNFSQWVEVFAPGAATVSIAAVGSGQPLLSKTVVLTPGPLLLALRADNRRGPGTYWPPTEQSLEPIAASYVPSAEGTAGIRLFNLSPDTPFAGFKSSASDSLATDIQYSLGSAWAQIAAGKVSLQVFDSLGGKALGAALMAVPPLSPAACTLFLLGTQGDASHPPFARLEVDAPLGPS